MGRFDGKVALVTGAGSGIGVAVALGLAAEGAGAVVAADISGEPPVDVSDPAQVDELVDRIVRDHGRLDVVVHAAGVDDPWAKGLIADSVVDGAPRDQVHEGDFHGPQVHESHPHGLPRPRIPDIPGACVARCAADMDSATKSSKAGVQALSQAVAKEAIAFGVRVNVVAPGPTETAMAGRTPQALRQRMRYATAGQIADIVLYLAGERSANLVGAVLLANGGRFTA